MAYRLPPNAMIANVTLIVRARDRALGFYRDLLGLQVAHEADGRIALAPPDGDTLLYLQIQPNAVPKPRRTIGLYHVALLMPNRESLGALLRRLIAAGYPLQGASDHAVSEALYLADPDGNGLEIYRDRPRDQWRFDGDQVAMVTEPMDVEGVLDSATADFDGMPAETIIGHVHLHVRDLAAAEAFYSDTIGFEVMQPSYPGVLFVAAGGYHHHLGLNIWAGTAAPPENALGLAEITVRLPGELAGLARALEAPGISAARENGALLLHDMDGNRLRFIE